MKKIIVSAILLFVLWPLSSQAVVLPAAYPRLANYFLRWEIKDSEVSELAKWDLLILDMEVSENSRPQLERIRQLNPKIIILAYLTSQEIIDDINDYNNAYLRQELYQDLIEGWWLKDDNNNRVSNWPETSMLNLTDGAATDSQGRHFNDYLPEFVVEKLQASCLWDGVFFDNTWGDVAWVNSGNLDIDNDGQAESSAEIDQLWASGFKEMLARTRELAGPEFIIVGNGRVYEGYQGLMNGMMLESFPSTWENGGTWSGSMKTYLKLPTINRQPSLPVINVYNKNQNDYQRVRFGLASTLLGDGFFSYDYDVTNHGQIWWYDEYDFDLGVARSKPYNLLPGAGSELKAGLWRRDFKNGLAIVNSTSQVQTYIFSREDVSRFTGSQDPITNSGARLNYLKLAPRDGVILAKKNLTIINSPFTNGYFYRVFNRHGAQIQDGFFSYINSFPGDAEVFILADQSGNEIISTAAYSGQTNVYQNNRVTTSFRPYNKIYSGQLSLGIQTSGNNFDKIAIGAGSGGGPQVRIFNGAGRLLGSWFAYDNNFRGGVNVALGDVDNDGIEELVTGPGPGMEPIIKVFSLQGQERARWLVYDQKFRGGVNVTLADINNDGQAEIVTAPASQGGPQVRIFTGTGREINSFFAYNKNWRGGLKISASDLDGDGQVEIMAGLKNFY
jgi:hypothetical protein